MLSIVTPHNLLNNKSLMLLLTPYTLIYDNKQLAV